MAFVNIHENEIKVQFISDVDIISTTYQIYIRILMLIIIYILLVFALLGIFNLHLGKDLQEARIKRDLMAGSSSE
jgi:predicted ABC-type sugar transport system permease subunit